MSAQEKELKDKLLLELLDLIEQSVNCKVNIEAATNEGQLLLAKSRYIQGTQFVCKSKLPNENSKEFNALNTVTKASDGPREDCLTTTNLQLDRHAVDKEAGYVDPIKWFGILVPRSLQRAQEQFIKALQYVTESANVNLRLHNTIKYLLLLENKTAVTQ